MKYKKMMCYMICFIFWFSCSKKEKFSSNRPAVEEPNENSSNPELDKPIEESNISNILKNSNVNHSAEKTFYTRLMKPEYIYVSLDILNAKYTSDIQDLVALIEEYPENSYDGSFKNLGIIGVYPKIIDHQLAFAKLLATKFINSGLLSKICSTKDSCIEDLAKTFIPRVWRKMPTKEDLDELSKLYQSFSDETKDYNLLVSIFASPAFHNKRQLTSPSSIEKAYHMGSKISFAISGSIPDEQLLVDMQNESILHPNIARKHIRRLIQENPDKFSRLFVSQWLKFSTVMDMMGEEVYKGVALKHVLNEPNYIFAHLLRDNGDLSSFFDLEFNAVNKQLAQIYGISGDSWKKVEKNKTLFGTAAMSYVFTDHETDIPHPIRRGYFIASSLLCNSIPDPSLEEQDAVAKFLEETEDQTKDLNPVEKMEFYRKNPACGTCHAAFDKYGDSLEGIGALGEARSTYNNGDPIKESGTVDGIKFNTSAEFVAGFAKLINVKSCFTSQVFNYFSGEHYTKIFNKISINKEINKINSTTLNQMIEDIAVYALTGENYK